MHALLTVGIWIALPVAGFVAGGLIARFFIIEDSTGFAGATTAALWALGGAAAGLVLAAVLVRRF